MVVRTALMGLIVFLPTKGIVRFGWELMFSEWRYWGC